MWIQNRCWVYAYFSVTRSKGILLSYGDIQNSNLGRDGRQSELLECELILKMCLSLRDRYLICHESVSGEDCINFCRLSY